MPDRYVKQLIEAIEKTPPHRPARRADDLAKIAVFLMACLCLYLLYCLNAIENRLTSVEREQAIRTFYVYPNGPPNLPDKK